MIRRLFSEFIVSEGEEGNNKQQVEQQEEKENADEGEGVAGEVTGTTAGSLNSGSGEEKEDERTTSDKFEGDKLKKKSVKDMILQGRSLRSMLSSSALIPEGSDTKKKNPTGDSPPTSPDVPTKGERRISAQFHSFLPHRNTKTLERESSVKSTSGIFTFISPREREKEKEKKLMEMKLEKDADFHLLRNFSVDYNRELSSPLSPGKGAPLSPSGVVTPLKTHDSSPDSIDNSTHSASSGGLQSPSNPLSMTSLGITHHQPLLPKSVSSIKSLNASYTSHSLIHLKSGSTFDMKKRQNHRTLLEIIKETGLDKRYVFQTDEVVFAPIRKRTHSNLMRQEDFVNLFIGKIAPAPVLYKMFKILDKDGNGLMDEKEFFRNLVVIFSSKSQELTRLSLLFTSYDDDDSGELEESEFNLLLAHVRTTLEKEEKLTGKDLDNKIEELRLILDPKKQNFVTKERFLQIALTDKHWLQYLFPESALDFENSRLYPPPSEKTFSSNSETSPEVVQLFSLMQDEIENDEKIELLLSSLKEKIETKAMDELESTETLSEPKLSSPVEEGMNIGQINTADISDAIAVSDGIADVAVADGADTATATTVAAAVSDTAAVDTAVADTAAADTAAADTAAADIAAADTAATDTAAADTAAPVDTAADAATGNPADDTNLLSYQRNSDELTLILEDSTQSSKGDGKNLDVPDEGSPSLPPEERVKSELLSELSVTDSYGATLLHYAVISNKEKSTLKLINSGLDPNQKYQSGKTVLHSACIYGLLSMVKLLLDNGASINAQDDLGSTPLHLIVRSERENTKQNMNDIVTELLNRGALVQMEDRDGCAVLDTAARYGQPEYFNILLKYNANVQHSSKNGYTPLHWAANNGFATAVNRLILAGAPVNATTPTGITPFHLAAARSELNCMEQLLKANCDTSVLDANNRTPLHLCVSHKGDPRCVKFLIKVAPESLKQKDIRGASARDIAEIRNNIEALSIIDAGPLQPLNSASEKLLHVLKHNINDPNLTNLIQNSTLFDVNCANENGTTPLHYTTMAGKLELTESLLDKNANPNIGNCRGTTPIHKAPQRGELKCLIALLNAGGNINVQDEEYITPLHRGLNELGVLKAKKKKLKKELESEKIESKRPSEKTKALEEIREKMKKIESCVKELVNRKAKLNISDHAGMFALEVAARFGLQKIIQNLIDHNASLSHCSNNGWSALHWTCFGGFTKSVKLLIENSAQVNMTSKSSDSHDVEIPLHLAVSEGHLETTKLVIEMKGDVTLTDPKKKQNIIHMATNSGSSELLKYLLESYSMQEFVKERDSMGNTPLHLARNGESIELLLAHGSDMFARNGNDESPLLCAAKWGYISTVPVWISKGLDIHEKNSNRLTALYLGCLGGYNEIAMILKKSGAEFFHEKEKETSTNGMIKFVENPNRVYLDVEYGTMSELVQHAANKRYFDKNFVKKLLIGFRSFTTPDAFFSLLLTFYETPDVKSGDPIFYSKPVQPSSRQQIEYDQSKKMTPPVGVCSVVFYWMKWFWQDFENNDKLMNSLMNFISTIPVSLSNEFQIFCAEKMENSANRKTLFDISTFYETKKPVTNFVLEYDPKVVAEQLTILEDANLKKIDFTELLRQSWTRKQAEALAPNVIGFIRHFNRITSWVITEILKAEKKSLRIQIIKKFIKVANFCYELRNFNSVMEIISGLESPSISRLRKTWEEVGKATVTFEVLKEQFTIAKNYKQYRAIYQKAVTEAKDPVIPILGVQLQDLIFLEEGNKDYANEIHQTINFSKITMLSDIIYEIRRIQKKNYVLKSDNNFLSQLASSRTLNDKEAYDESLKLEPRKN